MRFFSSKRSMMLLSFCAGLSLGIAIPNLFPFGAKPPKPAMREVRALGYQYTRPLMECELDTEAKENRELTSFRNEIEKVATACEQEGLAGQVSVYFRDLNNGPWFSIDPEDEFIPASLLKVPTMISVFRLAEKDPTFLKGTVTIPADFPTDWGQTITPVEMLERGKTYTIEDLVYRMIAHSDNAATAVLNSILPPNMDGSTNRDLGVGFHETEGNPGYLSVETYASFFRILYNASYLNREMSERALALLAKSDFPGGIIASVPKGVEVAQKFGHWMLPPGQPYRQQLHDCGIVYFPGRPYLLCVMTRGNEIPALDTAIRRVSAEVYRQVELQTGREN
jgi:beta-lactamase class A